MSKAHNNGVEVKVISADKLYIDPTYQRWTSKQRVRKIADNFDWNAVGIPTVSKRKDGRFAVLDGQNRLKAMQQRWPNLRIKGQPISLLCEVRSCRKMADEAQDFIARNENQRNLNANAFFHAGGPAGDETVKVVTHILNDHGIHVLYGGGRCGPNETRCAGVLKEAYETLGVRKFKQMVRLLTEVYLQDGYVEKKALKAMFLRGLMRYLETERKSFATIRNKLMRGYCAEDILNDAKSEISTFAGWGRDDVVAKHINGGKKLAAVA